MNEINFRQRCQITFFWAARHHSSFKYGHEMSGKMTILRFPFGSLSVLFRFSPAGGFSRRRRRRRRREIPKAPKRESGGNLKLRSSFSIWQRCGSDVAAFSGRSSSSWIEIQSDFSVLCGFHIRLRLNSWMRIHWKTENGNAAFLRNGRWNWRPVGRGAFSGAAERPRRRSRRRDASARDVTRPQQPIGFEPRVAQVGRP